MNTNYGRELRNLHYKCINGVQQPRPKIVDSIPENWQLSRWPWSIYKFECTLAVQFLSNVTECVQLYISLIYLYNFDTDPLRDQKYIFKTSFGTGILLSTRVISTRAVNLLIAPAKHFSILLTTCQSKLDLTIIQLCSFV